MKTMNKWFYLFMESDDHFVNVIVPEGKEDEYAEHYAKRYGFTFHKSTDSQHAFINKECNCKGRCGLKRVVFFKDHKALKIPTVKDFTGCDHRYSLEWHVKGQTWSRQGWICKFCGDEQTKTIEYDKTYVGDY